MFKTFYRAAVFSGCLFFIACRSRHKTVSFYYWKTYFTLDTGAKKALRDNTAQAVYTRYFDVDMAPGDAAPRPVAVLRFDSSVYGCTIVPVVYFRNRVFEKTDTTQLRMLAVQVHTLVSAISDSIKTKTREIQFDCDWTEHTRDNYFFFLRNYRAIAPQTIGATIRLHQVKYSGRTGIPPVDYGVLMYYNMGDINAGEQRSVYERATALRYLPSLERYPLTMDIALPVFCWGLQIREGRVIQLLNKMDAVHFENDTNFIAVKNDWFTARNPCFSGGYYFRTRDSVKIEQVGESELMDMVSDINRYSNHHTRNLIFYDLDKKNLNRYDKNVFRKILDHLR